MSDEKQPILVVLQLTGGNDALNTIVPYGDGLYYDNRRTARIPQEDVLPIDNHFGFHPAMRAIKPFWDEGKMAIIAGVGYPNPNYSHFRSMDIWYTCEPEKIATEGWLGKAVQVMDPKAENVLTAVNLRGIAQVKLADLGTRVFYTSHGSFDTHATQLPTHAKLWQEVSEGVAAFFEDLRAHNAADDVLMLIWSEFGRRVKDNGAGTDHGAGSVALVIGDHVKGGMYGEYPSLKDLTLGNLKYNVDFRSAYASILNRWMNIESEPIVNGKFEEFALV